MCIVSIVNSLSQRCQWLSVFPGILDGKISATCVYCQYFLPVMSFPSCCVCSNFCSIFKFIVKFINVLFSGNALLFIYLFLQLEHPTPTPQSLVFSSINSNFSPLIINMAKVNILVWDKELSIFLNEKQYSVNYSAKKKSWCPAGLQGSGLMIFIIIGSKYVLLF